MRWTPLSVVDVVMSVDLVCVFSAVAAASRLPPSSSHADDEPNKEPTLLQNRKKGRKQEDYNCLKIKIVSYSVISRYYFSLDIYHKSTM